MRIGRLAVWGVVMGSIWSSRCRHPQSPPPLPAAGIPTSCCSFAAWLFGGSCRSCGCSFLPARSARAVMSPIPPVVATTISTSFGLAMLGSVPPLPPRFAAISARRHLVVGVFFYWWWEKKNAAARRRLHSATASTPRRRQRWRRPLRFGDRSVSAVGDRSVSAAAGGGLVGVCGGVV